MSSSQSIIVENIEEKVMQTHPSGFLLHLVQISNKKLCEAAADVDTTKTELKDTMNEVARLRMAIIMANKKAENLRNEIAKRTCLLELRADQLHEAVAELRSSDIAESLEKREAAIIKMKSRLVEDDLQEARQIVASMEREFLNEDSQNTPAPQQPRSSSASGDLGKNKDSNDSSNGSDADGGTKCCICWESYVNSVIYRCGHICTCYQCALELIQTHGEPKCPICRVEITDVIQTFKC